MTSLLNHYMNQCDTGTRQFDPAQADIFTHLDHLTISIKQSESKRRSLFKRFKKQKPITGLYLYGSVGAGKSYMMDTFYQALTTPNKRRVHFHAFMKEMHAALKTHAGEANPIKHIIHQFAKKVRVLCFDEFIVNDIADAMILGRVFSALFDEGVCVVITSNMEPDQLYLKGVQRISFLPTIALLKKHLTVLPCLAKQDYRLRQLANAGTFHTPINENTDKKLEESFLIMSTDHALPDKHITLADRAVSVIKVSNDCVWFDFNVICHPPRSQHDYLELSERYKTIIVSHIPVMQANQHNLILLFIRLIDVLYDAKCRLICSAEAPVTALYPEGRFTFDYQRTASRLLEMQSLAYVMQRA